MRCLQCGKKLSLLRKIADGEFCSAEHRGLYQRSECQLALLRLKESQVRIERPTPQAAKAAMAAVGRLRAMDSSASDPVFVETHQFVEGVRPLNLRRMAQPSIEPAVAERAVELPERLHRQESRSFASCGPLEGVVEPRPVQIQSVPWTLALRPLFRLGVRLLASGVVRRTNELGQAGLSSLSGPRPILRPGRIRGMPLEVAGWVFPNESTPKLPAIEWRAGLAQPEAMSLLEPQPAIECALPLPIGISAQLPAIYSEARPLPHSERAPFESMRTVRSAAMLSVIGVPGESVHESMREPAQDPATLQPLEPLALRIAVRAAAPAHASAEAFETHLHTSLPGSRPVAATLSHLRACEELEPLKLRASAARTVARLATQPAAASPSESLPAFTHAAAFAMRSDGAMRPVELRSAAGIPLIRTTSAAAIESLDVSVPKSGAILSSSTVLGLGDRLLAVVWPAAEAGSFVARTVDTAPTHCLEPALPAHEGVHTTTPRMRGESGLQPITLSSPSVPTPAPASMPPKAMAATAAAGAPALPGHAFRPEPIAGDTPVVAPSMAAIDPVALGAAPEPADESGEPIPPAIDRQLPMAMGRALSAGIEYCGAPADSQTPIWEASYSFPPAAPAARLTIDHADGSGSRQGRTAAPRGRRSLIPSLNLRGLPGRRFWTYAPADLKWVALGLPLILVFVVYSFRGSQPKTEAGPVAVASETEAAAAPSGSSRIAESLKNVLVNRAAVNLLDDFRGGLGAWQGGEGWAKSWRYGQATFLEPGALAFYRPSMTLRDYSLEFLGQIQHHSLNWVVRAKDARNYYAMRIAITRPGPMPEAQIVQYAVINGKEERRKAMPIPYPVRPDTMYLVRVDVRGSDFNVYLQGQPLYSFTDSRLKEGGIGFFSPKGDKSYLRWVQIQHQYDYVGRLCALLAPYQVASEASQSE